MCMSYLLKYPDEILSIQRFGTWQTFNTLIFFSLIWLCALFSWQHVVIAISGAHLSIRNAARHLAKLLIGKYLPGGVWGFLSRHADASFSGSMRQKLMSGFVEQSLGLFCVACVGCLIYLSAAGRNVFLLIPIFALPWAYLLILHFMVTVLHWFQRKFSISYARPALLMAVFFSSMQQIITAALLIYLTMSMLDLAAQQAMLVAGAYLLAVVVGMLAIFAPSGIFVREAVFIGLLYGTIDRSDALALAVSFRILFLFADFLYAIMVLLLNFISRDA